MRCVPAARVIAGAGTFESPPHRPSPRQNPRTARCPRDAGCSARRSRQVQQPRSHHAAVAPDLGHLMQVEREFGLVLHDRKALGVRLHQTVFDAVVNHLGEVPAPLGPTCSLDPVRAPVFRRWAATLPTLRRSSCCSPRSAPCRRWCRSPDSSTAFRRSVENAAACSCSSNCRRRRWCRRSAANRAAQ